MLPRYCTDTVTIIRAGITDGVRRERDWSNAERFEIGRCSVQPSTTEGTLGTRENGSETVTAYFQPGSDVRPGDRMEFAGKVYSMLGEPIPMRSPFGRCDAVQASFKRWRG